MILFFGTKPGKQISQKLLNVACGHCSQTGTMTAVSQPNYFHLFWLPLFKIGVSQFVECGHCKRVYYKNEFNAEMKRALEHR